MRLPAVATATFIAALACTRWCTRPQPEAPAAPPIEARTTELVDDFFGINEAITVPEKRRDGGLDRDTLEAMLRDDALTVQMLGARIVRAHTAVYPELSVQALRARDFDWGPSDLYMLVAQEQDLDVLMMLGPWPGNHTHEHTDRYVPEDLAAYETAITRIVERYDGDGKDDAPGLKRGVLAWEVDNEPDLHHTADGAPEGFQSPAEYAEVLKATSRSIRAADKDATVLLGGIYRPHRDKGRQYLEQLLAIEGVGDSFDVLSLHVYFDDDDLESVRRTLTTAKELAADKPLWITETSVPSDKRKPHVDEVWQARMVVAIHGAFLAGGADRVFWHTIADPPRAHAKARKRTGFSTNSLMRAAAEGLTKTEKPAAEAYKNLVTALHGIPRDEIARREDGLLVVGDRGWLVYWGTAEVPRGATSARSLLDDSALPLDQPVPAPAFIAR